MDFKELCEKEPGLRELEQDIVAFRATKKRLGSCVTEDWYRRFKPRLVQFVGFDARGPLLASCECYDTAYQHLCKLLSNRKRRPRR
jgi:hypothetical protein